MKHGYAETPEGQIHYVTEGSGNPLMLLHMSPLSWTMYRAAIPLLSRAHRVVAMDTPGFGNSDPAPSSYKRLADYAQVAVHLLDSLGIERADVWGTFTGSLIASEVAAQFPDRVRRLVLLGVPMCLTREEREGHIERMLKRARFTHDIEGQYLMNIVEHALGFTKKASADRYDKEYRVNFEWLDDWVIGMIKVGPTFPDMIAKVYGHESQPRLPLIKAETLVIGLSAENVSPFIKGDRAREVQKLILRSKLVMLGGPGADMQVTYERAEDLAKIILPFLEGGEPGKAK